MTAMKIYTLSPAQLDDFRLSVEELANKYGADSLEFHEGMLARGMWWANLIAEDWGRACELKAQGYWTQETAHEGAVAAVAMYQNRIVRVRRQVAKAKGDKTRRKVKKE